MTHRPQQCPACGARADNGDRPSQITELRRVNANDNRVYRCRNCGHIWSPVPVPENIPHV